jgi:UDP-GlcNAc:undecaprenyl-phosphate/decaprenyl-phosphate GlcNAc-1-phosphate transferase
MGLLLAVAILSSFYLTPIAMRFAWKHDAVSRPDGFRKKHSRPTPEWGGLAVNASLLLGLGLSYLLVPVHSTETPFLAALAFSIVILCLLGCYDDLFDMRAGAKLAGQLLAVVPLIAVGAYAERFTVFGLSIELGLLGIPWTIAWIVLGINAMNLIDGMDGLASTVGVTVAAAVAVIAGATGNTHIAVIAVVLAGALSGFLAHNLPPARIYLGDCGSMVIGLVLATLALRVVPQTGPPNLTAMCALLFIPLYDTILAIIRRGLNGNGIMTADRGRLGATFSS